MKRRMLRIAWDENGELLAQVREGKAPRKTIEDAGSLLNDEELAQLDAIYRKLDDA